MGEKLLAFQNLRERDQPGSRVLISPPQSTPDEANADEAVGIMTKAVKLPGNSLHAEVAGGCRCKGATLKLPRVIVCCEVANHSCHLEAGGESTALPLFL